MNKKELLFTIIALAISVVVAIAAMEIALRLKNSSMTNYDMEMWRYAKELKKPSSNPDLGHEHIKNSSAILQSVNIRINEWGLRGGPVEPDQPGKRRILVLGDSITLGWGVNEKDVLTSKLQEMFASNGQKVEVLNAGVGNYNAQRYIDWFFDDLQKLHPTDIVVNYFLRDAEELEPGGGNAILRNSELAVTLWIAGHRLFDRAGETSLIDHYKQVYTATQPGWIKAQVDLKKLSDYAKANKIRIYLAMIPDVHNLTNYKFTFVHDLMKNVAEKYGYVYVDYLPALTSLSPEQIWAMPGDPHPNRLGHKLMAETLFPILQRQ